MVPQNWLGSSTAAPPPEQSRTARPTRSPTRPAKCSSTTTATAVQADPQMESKSSSIRRMVGRLKSGPSTTRGTAISPWLAFRVASVLTTRGATALPRARFRKWPAPALCSGSSPAMGMQLKIGNSFRRATATSLSKTRPQHQPWFSDGDRRLLR
jgi:hypothetical protein